MTHDPCPFCGGRVAAKWRSIDVVECVACGLLRRDPQPTDAALAEMYTTGWANPDENYHQTGGTTPRLARRYAELLQRDVAGGLAGKSVCDVGAGRGDLVASLIEFGARACAVDPFGNAYLASRGISVYNTIREAMLGEARGGFDGVILNDVIEHVRDPLQTLREIRECIRPGGWLFVSTPNAAGLKARVLGSRWKEARKPVHLFFFSPKTLSLFAQRAGFARTERLKWHIRFSGNPVDVVWHHTLQELRLDGSVRMLLVNEE